MVPIRFISLVLLLLFINNAYAFIINFNNLYNGFELGEAGTARSSSNLNYQSGLDPSTNLSYSQSSMSNDGFGGRAYMGYQLSSHLAIEGGYTQYADTKVTEIYGFANENTMLNEGIIDTLLKWSWPIYNNTSAYIEGGEALVMTQSYVSDPVTGNLSTTGLDTIQPMYGVGVSYAFSSQVSVELSWSQVAGGNGVPTCKLLGAGINVRLN